MDSFNLVKNSWIKVFDECEKEVSLATFFNHAHKYNILAGESHQQDLSTLRFLLAIVQRVYSGETIESLLKLGKFDDRIQSYLNKYQDCFDMQGGKPFYQVTADQYNRYADTRFKIKTEGKQTGTLAIRQLNRNISESNNSPNVLSTIPESKKDKLSMPELVRWLIAYQNYAGTSDKSKAVLGYPIRVSAGSLYKTDPVYLRGENLFETLVLNFTEDSASQKPTWEWNLDDYVSQVNEAPDNVSQVYTLLSRLIYIDWSNDKTMILVTGLPMPTGISDPMSMVNDNGKIRVRNLQKLHDYVAFELDKVFELPAFQKLNELELKNKNIAIINNNYVGDPRNPSQAPVATVFEELSFNSDLFYRRKEDMLAVSRLVRDVIQAYSMLVYNIDKIKHTRADKKRIDKSVDEFKDTMLELIKNWLYYPAELKEFAIRLEDVALKEKDEKIERYLSIKDLNRTADDGKTIFELINIYGFTIRKIIKNI